MQTDVNLFINKLESYRTSENIHAYLISHKCNFFLLKLCNIYTYLISHPENYIFNK